MGWVVIGSGACYFSFAGEREQTVLFGNDLGVEVGSSSELLRTQYQHPRDRLLRLTAVVSSLCLI